MTARLGRETLAIPRPSSVPAGQAAPGPAEHGTRAGRAR